MALVVLCVIAASGYVLWYRSLPAPGNSPVAERSTPEWPKAESIPASVWPVFQASQNKASNDSGPLARRFRLAGTFFVFAEPGSTNSGYCKAIVDDLEKKQQCIVKEGDLLDAVAVLRILHERIVLRDGDREEELLLGFGTNAMAMVTTTTSNRVAGSGAVGQETVLESNKFGKRVGENRWVISRETLMDYYRELRDDPERTAALFASMKPDYQNEAINGYRVDMEGEKDFFGAVGLHDGDVVRKVNSMNMTSQARAEYFIREFVSDRVNAIVLDIERDNQPQKLIYMIR